MELTVKKILALVMVIAVIVIVVGAFAGSMKTVPTGYKGIKIQWGRIVGTLDEGLHFINPMTGEAFDLMSLQIQKVETTESAASSDLQEVTTTVAVNYQLESAYTMEIYRDMRNEYEDRVISPNIQESIKATTAEFTASALITNRSAVKSLFQQTLDSRLEQFHINVLSVSIVDFQFSDEFSAAIEAANTAKQKAIEAKNDLERVRYEQEQKIITAKAEANATLTAATAQAEAIQLINSQITLNYLKYLQLIQWDGKLPIYYGSNIPLFILWEEP